MAEGSPVTAAAPRPQSRLPIRLLLFGAVALASVELGFLAFGVDRSRLLVKQYGYYTIAGTFVWALFALWRVGPAAFGLVRGLSRRERWQAAGVVIACTTVVLLTTPINYKILYDEMVLQSTASDMHIYREVSTIVRAYLVDGVFAPLDTYVDKRPFFFPFLVSLIHDVTGYREGNAFALNAVLLPLILAQLYLFVRRLAGHGGALAAVLALGTLSTLAQSSTSAGMEALNLAMIILTMNLAMLYLDAPDGPRLSALILSAVLLAQTRYESSLFVLPVACVALEGWRRAGRIIMPVAAILAPALLIPYAVHNTYLSGTPSLWELKPNEQTRFSTDHLLANLEHAWKYFFDNRGGLTNSLWLSIAGFGALAYGALALWLNRRAIVAGFREPGDGAVSVGATPPRVSAATPDSPGPVDTAPLVVLVAFSGAIIGNLGLLMFYYWGQLDDPTVARLALPFSLLLAMAIGFAVHHLDASAPKPAPATESQPGETTRLRRPWRSRFAWLAAGGAVLAYLWSGLDANELHNQRNTLSDELAWECQYVEAMPPGERLIITNKSALPWMLRRISAISIERARRRVDALRDQLEQHTFRDLLVTQDYQPTDATGNFRINPPDRLPDWWILETVAEKRFGAHVDRISRLVEIKPHESTSDAEKVESPAKH